MDSSLSFHRFRHLALITVIAAGVPLVLTSSASASCTKAWTGGFSSNWEDWQNWSQCDPSPNDQEAPDADDDVVIDGAAVTLSSGTTINSVTIGATTTTSLTYNSSNNNPNMQAAGGIVIGSHGSVTLDGTTGNNHGAATLDVRASTLLNNGTITMSGGGAAFAAPQLAGNLANNGTINVNVNAKFNESIAAVNILDNKGVIAIADSATLTASGASCGDTGDQVTNDTGGSINATGAGALVVNNYTQGDGTTSGTAPVVQSCGSLHYTGNGASSVLAVSGVTLTGSSHPGQSLTVRADNFNTNANATSGFTNGGAITLDCLVTGCAGGSGGAPVVNVGTNTLNNTGTITVTAAASGGGGFSGNLANAGTLQINGNAHMQNGGALTQTAGTTTVAAGTTLDVSNAANGMFSVSGGLLTGSGTIGGNATITGGQARPGSSPGTLTITGNYTQGAAATLAIPVNGVGAGQFSVLNVGGNATLAGTLALQPSAGYAASATGNDKAVGFVTFGGARSGTFTATTVTPPLSGGKSFAPSYVDASKRIDAVVTSDTAAPSVTTVHAGAANQLKRTFTVAYHATDSGSGVASYDVAYRRAAWNTKLGSLIAWKTKTTATTLSFTGALGYEYCFSVRARDVAGNVSSWSALRCAAIPLDDRSLVASAGWTKITGKLFFNGTAVHAAAVGRTLTRKGAIAGRAGLLVDKGRNYGSVVVFYNGKAVKTISLAATTTQYQVMIALPKITRGTIIVIKTTSRKVVRIDGLVLARV